MLARQMGSFTCYSGCSRWEVKAESTKCVFIRAYILFDHQFDHQNHQIFTSGNISNDFSDI